MLETKLSIPIHKSLIPLVILVGQLVPMTGCKPPKDAAADENLERSGHQDRGRNPGDYKMSKGYAPDSTKPGDNKWVYKLNYTDIILTPDGEYILSMAPVPGPYEGWPSPGLVLVMQHVFTGEQYVFHDYMDLRRINFSPDGKVAFLLHKDGYTVSALDLTLKTIIWQETFIGGPFDVLDISPDGRFVVGTNLPTTDWDEALFIFAKCSQLSAKNKGRCRMGVIDTQTDIATVHKFKLPLRDLDFSPVHDEVIVTSSTWDKTGVPETTLAFIDLKTSATMAEVSFPNCADELKIQPDGVLGLLAPTQCGKDPISVIDLAKRKFIKNLPGFGPVSISPDGTKAVGFTRRAAMLQDWGVIQKQPFGLIIVELDTLNWVLLEYGDKQPSYLFSADSQYVITHGRPELCEWKNKKLFCHYPEKLVRINADTLNRVEFHGPAVELTHFVANENTIYAIDKGELFMLDPTTATVSNIPVTTNNGKGVIAEATPDLINIRPQKDMLVLGESDAPMFYLVPLLDSQTLPRGISIAP